MEDLGYDLNDNLWTAKLLNDHPEALIKAHLEYIKAGATCITTASYQASITGLMEAGYSKDKAQGLIKKSVILVQKAIQTALDLKIIDTRPLIAGSIGPYGAYLADGSEYHGNYAVTDSELIDFHVKRIEILDQSGVDLLACETIPSFQEAKILSKLLEKTNNPAWISFTCNDESYIRDGSEIKKCISIFKNHPKVFAVGVNCTHPSYISDIIHTLKYTNTNKKIIIYPNSGELYEPKTKTWIQCSETSHFTDLAQEWLDLGADIIGGCCRIGPNNIKYLHKLINYKNS